MKSKRNENQKEQLEIGVKIFPSKNGDVACPDNKCVCRALKYDFKKTKLLFGSVFLVTHLAALVSLGVLFGGGKSRDNKLLALQMDLQAMQSQCDSSIEHLKDKIRIVENLLDKKLNLTKFEERDINFEAFEWQESSNENSNAPNFYDDSLPNFIDGTNVSDYIGQSDDKISKLDGNAIGDERNRTNDNEIPNEELCSTLLACYEDLQKYSGLSNGGNSQSSRTKRSNLRGKHKGRKSTRRQRVHPPNIRGPVASHFKGAVPEMFIEDGGLVAPWYPDDKASAAFTMKYEFREGKGTIEVSEEGLYLIYAQVYYLTTEILNTFMIQVREKDALPKPIAYCSSNAMVPAGGVSEVSCYTSVIRYLNTTNQVYVTQRDRNRRMILREGYSFLGLVLLNSAPGPKRRRENRN